MGAGAALQGLLTGKWMLGPPSGTGADVWRAVVEAVVCEVGWLGIPARLDRQAWMR